MSLILSIPSSSNSISRYLSVTLRQGITPRSVFLTIFLENFMFSSISSAIKPVEFTIFSMPYLGKSSQMKRMSFSENNLYSIIGLNSIPNCLQADKQAFKSYLILLQLFSFMNPLFITKSTKEAPCLAASIIS